MMEALVCLTEHVQKEHMQNEWIETVSQAASITLLVG